MADTGKKPRVRWTLLALLWFWALCVFVTLDLFRNVGAFDSIRPRATIYRAMRYVAHRMVQEPYLDDGFRDALPPLQEVPSAVPRPTGHTMSNLRWELLRLGAGLQEPREDESEPLLIEAARRIRGSE